MLTIKLVLTAIAILIGLVYVIGMVAEYLKNKKAVFISIIYVIAIFGMAIADAFYIRYFIELLEGLSVH